jgi:hypothetical protein
MIRIKLFYSNWLHSALPVCEDDGMRLFVFWFEDQEFRFPVDKSWPDNVLAYVAAAHVGLVYGDHFFFVDDYGRKTLTIQGNGV